MTDSLLERINKASLRFLAPLNPDDTYRSIIEEARKLLKSEHGSILLVENEQFKRVYSTTPHLNEVKVRTRGYTYDVYKTNKPKFFTGADLASTHPKLKEMGVCAVVMIPLSYKNKAIGVMTLQFLNQDTFGTDTLEVFMLFSSMASMAIRKAQLYAEVKEAVEIRDMFIALAAHELRTPLTSITGYISLIKQRLAKEKPIDSEWVSSLSREADRLKDLIEELLEVNRIKSGQLSFTFLKSSLDSIVNQTLERLRFTYPEHVFNYNNKSAGHGIMKGDYNKLLQAVNNLIENAAKYSPQGSSIDIDLEEDDEYYFLTIKDQGRGISEEDLPRIFDIFYKGKNNHVKGLGLGLYLTRYIIEKHNGSIVVQSQLGKGTTVTVTLPKTS
jgi:signal transduction histidine kinase